MRTAMHWIIASASSREPTTRSIRTFANLLHVVRHECGTQSEKIVGFGELDAKDLLNPA